MDVHRDWSNTVFHKHVFRDGDGAPITDSTGNFNPLKGCSLSCSLLYSQYLEQKS